MITESVLPSVFLCKLGPVGCSGNGRGLAAHESVLYRWATVVNVLMAVLARFRVRHTWPSWVLT